MIWPQRSCIGSWTSADHFFFLVQNRLVFRDVLIVKKILIELIVQPKSIGNGRRGIGCSVVMIMELMEYASLMMKC